MVCLKDYKTAREGKGISRTNFNLGLIAGVRLNDYVWFANDDFPFRAGYGEALRKAGKLKMPLEFKQSFHYDAIAEMRSYGLIKTEDFRGILDPGKIVIKLCKDGARDYLADILKEIKGYDRGKLEEQFIEVGKVFIDNLKREFDKKTLEKMCVYSGL